MMQIMLWLGKVHKVEQGAKRYVDGLFNNSEYQSGGFYASKKGLTGEICEQSTLFRDLQNTHFQDNAYDALKRFM